MDAPLFRVVRGDGPMKYFKSDALKYSQNWWCFVADCLVWLFAPGRVTA